MSMDCVAGSIASGQGSGGETRHVRTKAVQGAPAYARIPCGNNQRDISCRHGCPSHGWPHGDRSRHRGSVSDGDGGDAAIERQAGHRTLESAHRRFPGGSQVRHVHGAEPGGQVVARGGGKSGCSRSARSHEYTIRSCSLAAASRRRGACARNGDGIIGFGYIVKNASR